MAIVFQDPSRPSPRSTASAAQIAEAIQAHQRVPRRTAARRAVELLDLVGIRDPHQRARSYPHEFSGGMRQRALIAMAIANNPGLLIADEPTTALDVTVQAHILDVLKTAQRETGAAVLLITHDLSVVARAADRVHVMKSGRDRGDPAGGGGAAGAARRRTRRKLIAAMEAGDRPAAPRPGLRTVLEVRDLVRHHRGVKAVDGVSSTSARARPSGSSASRGRARPPLLAWRSWRWPGRSGGRIAVLGRDTAHVSRRDRRRIRRDLRDRLPGPSSSLDPRMTVGAIIAEPLTTHAAHPARVPELLAQVGLPLDYAARHPVHLSGGQRQRENRHRAGHRARPRGPGPRRTRLRALDPTIRAEIIALLEHLRAERGLSYLFVAHDPPLIRRIADRVAAMYRGRIAEIGPAHQIFAAPAHPYTRALLRALLSPARRRPGHHRGLPLSAPRCPLYAELPPPPPPPPQPPRDPAASHEEPEDHRRLGSRLSPPSRRSTVKRAYALLLALTTAACAAQPGEPGAPAAQVTAADLNLTPRAQIKTGGTLRWGLTEYPAQWNQWNHIDGNLANVKTVVDALMPRPFRADEHGVLGARPRLRDLGRRDPDDAEAGRDVHPEPEGALVDRRADHLGRLRRPVEGAARRRPGLRSRRQRHRISTSPRWPGQERPSGRGHLHPPVRRLALLFAPSTPKSANSSPQAFNAGWVGKIPATAGPVPVRRLRHPRQDGHADPRRQMVERARQARLDRRSGGWSPTPASPPSPTASSTCSTSAPRRPTCPGPSRRPARWSARRPAPTSATSPSTARARSSPTSGSARPSPSASTARSSPRATSRA